MHVRQSTISLGSSLIHAGPRPCLLPPPVHNPHPLPGTILTKVPSEAYRIQGEPGSQLETWEPKRALKNTQALLDWREGQSQEA